MKSYLGIDVSKLHRDLSQPAPAKRLANTEKAILSWLKSLPPETILVCEASGGYETLLLRLAHALRRPIILLNARQLRDFARAQNRLAKTDRIDARLIAQFAQTFQPAPLSVPDPLQEELSALVKHRSHLLTQITQNSNLTQTLTDKHLLRLIANTVAFLRKQVGQLEALIQTKIAASPDLRARLNRLCQVQGIGLLTASSLIALMPELGSLSDTEAAALAGVAPFNHDSGQFRGTTSHLRRPLPSALRPIHGRPRRLPPQSYPQAALPPSSRARQSQKTRSHGPHAKTYRPRQSPSKIP